MPTFEMLDGPMEGVEREFNLNPWATASFHIDDGTRRHWYCTTGDEERPTAAYSHSVERPPTDPRESVKPLRTVGELKQALSHFPDSMFLVGTWEGTTAVVYVYGGTCKKLFPLDDEDDRAVRVPHCFIDVDNADYRERWQK